MHKTIEFESNIRYLTTPLTRSTIFTVKKLAMDPLGRILMLRISSRANTPLFENLADVIEILGEEDFCTWEDASAAGTSYTENYSLISHARNFPRRIFPPSYVARYERGLFPVKGHYSNFDRALPKNISAKIGSRLVRMERRCFNFQVIGYCSVLRSLENWACDAKETFGRFKIVSVFEGFFFKSAEREGKRNVRDRTLCFSSLNIWQQRLSKSTWIYLFKSCHLVFVGIFLFSCHVILKFR